MRCGRGILIYSAWQEFTCWLFYLQRKSKAKEIYDKYVSMRSPDCVNVDSNARKQAEAQLESPTPQTFEVAQTQVN